MPKNSNITVNTYFFSPRNKPVRPPSKGLAQPKRHKLEEHQARIYSDDWMDELEREERRERVKA